MGISTPLDNRTFGTFDAIFSKLYFHINLQGKKCKCKTKQNEQNYTNFLWPKRMDNSK